MALLYQDLHNLYSIFEDQTKVVNTDQLADAMTDTDEVKMDVQKCSGEKDNYGAFQYESPHFSSSTKTTFIQHGLKICFVNQKHHPLNYQISTLPCHYMPQNYLEVGSITRLLPHHYQVRVLC